MTREAALMLRYLTDAQSFRRGREIEWVDPNKEVEALGAVQHGLRQEVGLKGLVVEVNPTSNLLIGDLGDLGGHPMWRLRPPRPSAAGLDTEVSVCIGSDDPVVFNSDLRGEYQLLYDALVMSGLSDHEAREWLEQTRADGMAARFTVASTPLARRADPGRWLTELRNPAPALAARVL
jgi:hypothetical protein